MSFTQIKVEYKKYVNVKEGFNFFLYLYCPTTHDFKFLKHSLTTLFDTVVADTDESSEWVDDDVEEWSRGSDTLNNDMITHTESVSSSSTGVSYFISSSKLTSTEAPWYS